MTQDANETNRPDKTGRRNFLRGAWAAAAGPVILAGATRIAKAQEGSNEVITGEGAHRYEWIEQYLRMPEGKSFGYTHAVRELQDGRILVHSTCEDAVAIFDPEGQFVSSWGSEYAAGAHGMDYAVEDGQEFLFLATTENHKVVKATPEGEKVFELGFPEESGLYESEAQYKPTNIAIASTGDFYVADGYGLHYIHRYGKDGAYKGSFGGRGDDPHLMNCPHGITVDTRDGGERLLIADRGHERLQYFDLEGEFIELVRGRFAHPCHFDIQGDLVVCPGLFGVVCLLDGDNQVVARLGENPECRNVEGWPNIAHENRIPGKFSSPHGASFAKDGSILVAEWINDGRITRLKPVA